jgi:hypothetical protein
MTEVNIDTRDCETADKIWDKETDTAGYADWSPETKQASAVLVRRTLDSMGFECGMFQDTDGQRKCSQAGTLACRRVIQAMAQCAKAVEIS